MKSWKLQAERMVAEPRRVARNEVQPKNGNISALPLRRTLLRKTSTIHAQMKYKTSLKSS